MFVLFTLHVVVDTLTSVFTICPPIYIIHRIYLGIFRDNFIYLKIGYSRICACAGYVYIFFVLINFNHIT